MTGPELRAERERARVRAGDVAIFLDRHPAAVTRLERRGEVDEVTVRRYVRAVAALRPLRRAVKQQLLKELAGL